MKTTCVLIDLGGRDNGHSQGDKDLSSVGAFQPWQHPRPSAPQAVLCCPMRVPVSLHTVGILPTSLPCSHPGMSLLMSLSPLWLFLETQSRGLIQTPSE